ncbi:glucosamine-6-phosphate deaminase [Dyadobacter tibetensis]|uniref:glucosamine-6-phosphate deaminase n=1 Tax=Dyadobacter tibetensis TaxID=1211851 RepID=UPI001E47C771|nr:glucosamine-6-phosphate deaminase [Dyadobacter tibetensis]
MEVTGMNINIYENKTAMSAAAGEYAVALIKNAIRDRGLATIVTATGASQIEMVNHIVNAPGIDWSKVVMFHLDEYIGLPNSHPASFRKYIQERYLDKLPPLQETILINGENDPDQEVERLNHLLSDREVDLALVGIGENGHLAFNDPPADFDTESPYLVVSLDEGCRQQQLGEGWFNHIDQVPKEAISMSVQQILKSRHLICTVPDQRKANAVKNCLTGPVSNQHPASILQEHPSTVFFFDREASALLPA